MIQQINFKNLFDGSPTPYLILATDLTIIDANAAYLNVTGRRREHLIGIPLFTAFPQNPDDPDESGVTMLRHSLEHVIATQKPHTMALQRYPIPVDTPDGTMFQERYWTAVNTPVFDDEGRLSCLCHSVIDVTQLRDLKDKLRRMEDMGIVHALAERNLFIRAQTIQEMNRVMEAEWNRLRNLFDQAPGFVAFTRGPDHEFELVNQAFRRLIGNRDVVGKPIREALPELEPQGYCKPLDDVYRSGEPFIGKAMRIVLSRDPQNHGLQSELYVDFVYQPIIEADGTVSGIVIEGHDITQQKRIEDELRASGERWKLVMEGSGDAFWDWDLRTNEMLLSRRWNELFGYTKNEVEISRDEMAKRIHPQDAPRVHASFKACITGAAELFSCEYRVLAHDNSWKWVHGRGRVSARDADGRALRITGTVTDISEKKRTEEQIWRQANYDALTGLPNRSLLRDRLDHEIELAKRQGTRFALCFIDLDRFKEVNDLLGHDVGDILLKQAAMRISKSVRSSDTVARLGGDEFTVILSGFNDTKDVKRSAQKILDALSRPFRLRDEVIHVSGSIGITVFPADGNDSESLLRNADQAMYVAKNGGRNQFSFFTRSMQKAAASRLRLIADLREALAGGQFQVFFQPIVDLTKNRIVKAEALLRWFHPKHGLYYPSQFIHLAEETGLISEIGNWVFMQSAFWSQRWSRQLGEPFQISVNKSPVQFYAENADLNWTDHLASLGMSADSISVEITEGVLLNASADVSEKLLRYRDAGMQIALDDFGTGYSSMSYLKKFDIDYLKIDQSFVRDMANDAGSRAIAESIILMAHKLGLKVIAEGIETEQQRDILNAAECDYGQGFLFSEALPPERLERLLQQELVSV